MKDISSEVSNNRKKGIRLINMNNNKKNIRSVDIDK